MSEKKRLLVVEDDEGLQRQLRWGFDDFDVVVAGDRNAALAKLEAGRYPVVLLDLGLPPDPDGVSEGFAMLGQLTSGAPDTKVIVITGKDDRANAVGAIGAGAYDFYQKPIDLEVIRFVVERAFELHDLERENKELALRAERPGLDGIVTSSPHMLQVCRMVEKVAAADATVLLMGESGTGKELVAKALHDLSGRSKRSFIAINCSAIPENLLESELFGYEKGAFTGAAKQTPGRIEYADRGVLFLDEIGDLPMSLQAKLLRFLQERVIERLGGRSQIPVDVRVVCATHQDVPALISEGRFREDLYYRISEVTIHIPPLRDRDDDAVLLARTFLERYGRQQGRALRGFTSDALAAIEAYAWPGNVRELENKIKRAAIMAEGQYVTPSELELGKPSDDIMPSMSLREVRSKAERSAIQKALGMFNGNISQAAALLEVSRPTLYALMEKYGLR